ncbi:MAG: hypothetical protein QMC40_03430 [Vicingaceae bacterium]
MRPLILTTLLLFQYSLRAQTNLAVDPDRIFWSDTTEIKWSDFQATNDSAKSLSAISKIELPYSTSSDREVDMTFTIQTCLVKSESWFKKGKQNNILLLHEQLHFDIAELHRRLIVKSIVEGSFNADTYEKEVDQIIIAIWENSYRKMQDKYDLETNYARIFKPQIYWNKKVADQLESMKEFQALTVTVIFQSK